MSCLDATIERVPIQLDMEALRVPASMTMDIRRLRPELIFTTTVVCGTSLGTTQVLYAQDGILLTVDGEKLIVPK